jgi:hypothetical protein
VRNIFCCRMLTIHLNSLTLRKSMLVYLNLGFNAIIYLNIKNFLKKMSLNFSCSLSSHSFLYHQNGELYSFGENNGYQLGFEEKKSILSPKLLMKDDQIKRISCGYNFTFIQKMNNDLLTFGVNVSKINFGFFQFLSFNTLKKK